MGRKQAAPADNTAEQMRAATAAAEAASREAAAAARAMQERSIAAAKESIERIKSATGKTASQYVQEAETAYKTIIPGITKEYKAELAAYNPEQALKPYAESARAGITAAEGAMGQRVKQDVEDYSGMLLAGATEAGRQLLDFSRAAGEQQKAAFKTFEESARGAQGMGLAQAGAITRGLSNLYNPEYQTLMSELPKRLSKSNVLEDVMAKNLYRNV